MKGSDSRYREAVKVKKIIRFSQSNCWVICTKNFLQTHIQSWIICKYICLNILSERMVRIWVIPKNHTVILVTSNVSNTNIIIFRSLTVTAIRLSVRQVIQRYNWWRAVPECMIISFIKGLLINLLRYAPITIALWQDNTIHINVSVDFCKGFYCQF